jgi:hypothetical protein
MSESTISTTTTSRGEPGGKRALVYPPGAARIMGMNTPGDPTNGAGGASPAVSAASMMDDPMSFPGFQELAESLLSRLSSIVGRSLSGEECSSIYQACVGAYTEAVRTQMKKRRELSSSNNPLRIKEAPSGMTLMDVRAVKRRFLDPGEECFFPGCEELRAERLERIAAAGGDRCPGCKRT